MAEPIGAILLLAALQALVMASACSFTVSNNCPHEIWPATLAGAGTPQLGTTGFRLGPGESAWVPAIPNWSGRIWARTGCTFNEQGVGSCETGDCSGRLECAGAGAAPPVTLFEITMGVGSGRDFYDVSLVDGYNLPVYAAPRGGASASACNATGCISDVNSGCPRELQVKGRSGGVVACRSACEVFGLDEYCCSGEYADPATCRPSAYAAVFKTACPRAYSYAFDDLTSTFTCKALEYSITFCPSPASFKTSMGGQIMKEGGETVGDPKELVSSSSSKTSSTGIAILLVSWLFLRSL